MQNVIDWTDQVGLDNARGNYFWLQVIPKLEDRSQLSGPFPAVLMDNLPAERFDASLVGGGTVEFHCGYRDSWEAWVVRDSQERLVEYTFYKHSHAVQVAVFSPFGMEDAEIELLAIEQRLPPREVPEAEWVNVSFWTQRPDGAAVYHDRRVEAPAWEAVHINYPDSARSALTDVHAWTGPPMSGGRLLLLHGPPGTGKTNLIRSIARAWKQWCTIHYVVDPENFFGSAHYMMSVLLDRDNTSDDQWRLVIVEDADELLSVEAKAREGQNVSRLLNVCDGLVGQGLRVLVLLTSNEPLSKMHPAIIRPGRCIANLKIGSMCGPDADAWRGLHDLPIRSQARGATTTLAELYEELRQPQLKTVADRVPVGFVAP